MRVELALFTPFFIRPRVDDDDEMDVDEHGDSDLDSIMDDEEEQS